MLSRLEPVWVPHAGQAEFLLQSARTKVLACGRRWGKTDACAVEVIAQLLSPGPSRCLVVAPTLDQARLLVERVERLYGELCACEDSGVGELTVRRTPYPHLRLGQHVVQARSGHVSRSLRGNQADLIVVDEAAYLPEELITEVCLPMMATTNGRLVMISTPNGLNHFWRFFQMGQRGEHGIWSRQSPSSESPYVSSSFLEIQRELISERAFRVEYGAEFADSGGRVFRTEAIERCLVVRLPSTSGPFVVGVDWARYQDFTAIAVVAGTREGAQLIEVQRFQQMPWSELVSEVSRAIERYPHARILCDGTGVGDPVVEMLQSLHPDRKVGSMVLTQGAKGSMIDGLAWMIERGCLKMEPNPELIRELQHFEAQQTSGGRMRLAARNGFHDDLVIALALACQQLPRAYRPAIALGQDRTFSKGARRRPGKGGVTKCSS